MYKFFHIYLYISYLPKFIYYLQGAIELLNTLIVRRPTHSFGGGVGRRKGNGQSSCSRCHSPPPTFTSYRLKTLKVEPNPTAISNNMTSSGANNAY
jgi:hypothetical protein